MTAEQYALPLPPELDRGHAAAVVRAQIYILLQPEQHRALRVCRTVEDIRTAMKDGIIAAILHIEGAEAIDPELEMLESLHRTGLRSLGPVWSRPTISGTVFPLPSLDTGHRAGLTDAGKHLVSGATSLASD